jgi:TfoX/Sxy family transcriptional regulator of competence genes
MAFSEALAGRIRDHLARRKGIEEKTMFGGVGFLLNGNMCVGVQKESLIVRIAPEQTDDALREPFVGPFQVGGRSMKGWLLVAPEGVADDAALRRWIDRALAFVAAMPGK